MGFQLTRQGTEGNELSPYFPEIQRLGALLADQERRAKEPPRPPIPGPEAPAEARIAALIRDLDRFGGRGSLDHDADPPVSKVLRALIREGDAAVGPLLAAVESDTRLTRHVIYAPINAPGGDYRWITTTGQAAGDAILGIFQARAIPFPYTPVYWNKPESRAGRARAIREAWEKARGAPAP